MLRLDRHARTTATRTATARTGGERWVAVVIGASMTVTLAAVVFLFV